MTATLERPVATPERQQGGTSREGSQPPPLTVGNYLRWVLAAISLGAGGIHFAMISPHWDQYWVEGVFFAALAWFQLAWAAGVVLRPSRVLLTVGAAVNAAAIGTWAVSRTWGVPFGPHAGVPEAASFVDIVATAFEGAVLLGCLALLLRPALASRTVSRIGGALPAGIAGLGVVALSTMAFTPSFASGHSSGPPGHPAGGGASASSGAAAGAHGAGAAAGQTNNVIAADGTSACEQAGVANEGNAGHGERGPVEWQSMDAATRTQLAGEIQIARDVAVKYATAADAEAAGYRAVTPYVPCIGAHYLKGGLLGNGFDVANPEILLYDNRGADAKLVGLSYLAFNEPNTPPEGFAGPNDPWHIHSQLCIGPGGVLGDESTSEADCEARGGKVLKLDNLFMNHMWLVPGWESSWGLFSSEHPDMGGKIGDINAVPDGEASTANLKDK